MLLTWVSRGSRSKPLGSRSKPLQALLLQPLQAPLLQPLQAPLLWRWSEGGGVGR
jgi:hypothetical protein